LVAYLLREMLKMLKKIICLICTFICVFSLKEFAKAQVVVSNPSSLAEQIKEWADHIVNLRQQLEQARAQVAAMTGSRGMQNLGVMAFGTIMDNLPDNVNNIYSDAQNTVSKYAQAAQSIHNAYTGKINSMSANDALRFVQQQLNQKGSIDRAMVENIYNNAMRELTTLKRLNDQIDGTIDVKASADLQNRIQTHVGLLNAEQEKLQLLAMLQKSQDKIIQKQAEQARNKALWGRLDTSDVISTRDYNAW